MTRIVTDALVIEHNLDIKSEELRAYAKRVEKSIIKDTFKVILDYIGLVSAENYWIQTSSATGSHIETQVSNILTQRSGRLLGSVISAFRFSQVRLPRSLEKFTADKFQSSKADFEGGKTESIRKVIVSGKSIVAQIGSKVEYAAVHEKGFPQRNIRARPFFKPAVEDAEPTILKIINEAIDATFNEARI